MPVAAPAIPSRTIHRLMDGCSSLTRAGLIDTLIGMTDSASEHAAPEADLAAYVGTEPADKVLREAGMAPTAAGKQRWRERLRVPIPQEALDEGQRRLA